MNLVEAATLLSAMVFSKQDSGVEPVLVLKIRYPGIFKVYLRGLGGVIMSLGTTIASRHRDGIKKK